jgi:Flp pilus assembly protein TadD
MKPTSRSAPRTPGSDIAAPLALMRAGDFANAAELFRPLARRQPDLLVAHAGLGHCAGRLGRRIEAVRALARAAQLAVRGLGRTVTPDAALDVAFELHALHAYPESLPLIEAVVRSAPTHARAHHMKAQVLERSAQPAAALDCAQRAAALAPTEVNAQLQLAALHARCGELDAARVRLESLAAHAPDAIRPRVMQELARVLDRQGDFAKAFSTMRAANSALLARATASGFDAGWLFKALEQERTLCDAAWLAEHGCKADDGRTDPVFLVGFYRSGTTLLDQMFASHSRIVSSGEAALLPAVLAELTRLHPAPGLHWTERWVAAGPDVADRLRATYFEYAEQAIGRLPAHSILLDKTTMNSIHVGLIRALFPRARIVFAHRDPRDVLISACMQSFDPTALTRLLLDWDLAARFLDEVLRHWRAMRPLLGDAAHDVRYEDVVAAPDLALSPLLASTGLAWEDGQRNFHAIAHLRPITTPSFADVSKPLHANAIGRWRHYAEHFDPVSPLLAPHLAASGYPA